jgi:hypothetical protein
MLNVGAAAYTYYSASVGLDGLEIESQWGRDFPHPSRPALVSPPQFPTKLVVKRSGHGINHLPPPSKGKGFPLQPSSGSWGSRRLRLLVRSSPLRTGRLHPQEFSWYLLLEAESTSGHMELSKLPEKFPSETTGDRSRDPLTCSAAP